MKQCMFGILLIIGVHACSQKKNIEIQNILEQIISHAEEASLYRNKVDWNTLRPSIYKLAEEAQSVNDLIPSLNYLLESLGDDHGRIMLNYNPIAYYYNEELKNHQKSFDPEINNQIQLRQTYKFHSELLDEKIGYLRIVGFPTGDNEKMAAKIQSEVCEFSEKGVSKWIIDLRYNGGGNMHPMAEGLALIIGNGIVGGAKGLVKSQNSIWKIEDNHFYYDDTSIRLIDNCAEQLNPKIAILTSVYTASSGEAIAIMFKGKENTKFFGGKTLGLSSVTDWYPINDSLIMSIAVSYYKDRNGFVYDEYVDVNEYFPFVLEPLTEKDDCIQSAMKWLTDKRK